MLNHIHLIIQAPDTAAVLRDFKHFTTRNIYNNLLATESDVAKLFDRADGHYRIWKEGNYPELIETDRFFHQKLDYIHMNPVKKQYVDLPEHWRFSSAGFYINEEPGLIEIATEF